MRFLPKFYSWKSLLADSGFNVEVPKLVNLRRTHSRNSIFFAAKRKENLRHFEKIKRCDGILVLNYDKGKSKGYIGGSTFAEIVLAFYFKKPIYLVNPIPRRSAFTEELRSWGARRWHSPHLKLVGNKR
jgi:hypothetical protein